MDVFDKETRSRIMSRIRGSKTKPELKIKRLMNLLEFSYQPKGIYGKPDFANKKLKIAVFVDGCFWHKCPKHYKEPKSNKKYWIPKIKRNVARAKEVEKILRCAGWKVIRIWEHDIRKISLSV
jgi:DNA mismatch endonuclease, patch repair protein